MLTSIEVVPPAGATWPGLHIALYPRPTDLLTIRDIKGLEPVPATVNTRPYGVVDGEFYSGTKTNKRNIVITFGLLNTDPNSVKNARDSIYYYFIARNNIKTRLRFHFNNRPSVDIEGYVESTPGDRFVKDPDMQVSIICPKPNFLSSQFEKISGVSGNVEKAATYHGSAPGGFVLELHTGPNAYGGDVYLQTRVNPSAAHRTMRFNAVMVPKHSILRVSTHQGMKRAEIIRASGDSETIYKKMEEMTTWLQFHAAPNLFRVLTPQSNIPFNWYLTYVHQYTGV